MDLDELFPSKPDDPLTQLERQDLDPLSVDELEERITRLGAEIARVKTKIAASTSVRDAAEAIFRKGGDA